MIDNEKYATRENEKGNGKKENKEMKIKKKKISKELSSKSGFLPRPRLGPSFS